MTLLALAGYLDEKFPPAPSVSMPNRTRWLYSLAALFLAGLQISCGGDSSGPGVVATSIEALTPTEISSPPGAAVDQSPGVIVRGSDGLGIAGATVTFAVTSGGGSIAGATQVTNSEGAATVGSWVLGNTPGINTLSATVAGLSPIVFTASSVDPCSVAVPHTLGTTTQGSLAATDCQFDDGTYVDYYSTNLPGGTYVFNQSSAFDTYLFMLTPGGAPIAVNDDYAADTRNSRIKAILPSGSYIVAANSFEQDIGAYALSSAATTAEVTGCEEVFVMKGITTAQSLQASDCTANLYSDEYILFLTSGQSLVVSMNSSALDSFLILLTPGNSVAASNDNRDAGTLDARFAYTAQSTGFYLLRARSAVNGSLGAYTLIIE